MAPLSLEGDTLGEKHKNFNKLVDSAKDLPFETGPLTEDDDIENLVKIEVACKQRNVEFILETFKSDDLLLISWVIKRSSWLITDDQYEHIINPEYLYNQLFPYMIQKAITKFLLQIRLYMNSERRSEAFFNYYYKTKNTSEIHFKWLMKCSVKFIVDFIANYKSSALIGCQIYKRLCENSFEIFEALFNNTSISKPDLFTATIFLAYSHTEQYISYLDRVESYWWPFFGTKGTEKLMKRCPVWVRNNFQKIRHNIDLATFAKYLNQDEINTLLLTYRNKKKFEDLYNIKNLEHFLKHIPKEERFNIFKTVVFHDNIKDAISQDTKNTYHLYRYAPFEIALTKFKKLIRIESSSQERNLMLTELLFSAGENLDHIGTVLKYYHDKHINEQIQQKTRFVKYLLDHTEAYRFTGEMWNNLNDIFYSMDVYTPNVERTNQAYIQTIILHNVLQGENISEIILKKFRFDSFHIFLVKLKENEKKKLFSYLYETKLTELKFDLNKINSANEFIEAFVKLRHLLILLNDWKKVLIEFPSAIEMISAFTKLKLEHSWQLQLSFIYNKNKSWRRYILDMAVAINPCDDVFINTLKYNPKLLSHYPTLVNKILGDHTIPLQRFLRKIRIYWRDTLAREFTNEYMKKLEYNEYKAAVIGLCTLLPKAKLTELLGAYAPEQETIDWRAVDDLRLCICKEFAQKMYLARPLLEIDTVLLYAKGDYLQMAVSPLNKILYNMSTIKSQAILVTFLKSPASLGKHGARMILQKIPINYLISLLTEYWKLMQNASMRQILFQEVYKLLCKQQNDSSINDLWTLLSNMMDSLTSRENRKIYKTMCTVLNVPVTVRGKFYEKSYLIIQALPSDRHGDQLLNSLKEHAVIVIELLTDDFIEKTLLEFEDKSSPGKYQESNIDIMAAYVVSSKDKDQQTQRYRRVIEPQLQHYLTIWNVQNGNNYYSRGFVKQLLSKIVHCSKRFIRNPTPVKMFRDTQEQLYKKIPEQQNYVLRTSWKLCTLFMESIEQNKQMSDCSDVELEIEKLAPIFGKACMQYLKREIERIPHNVYSLFAIALKMFFEDFLYPDYLDQQYKMLYFYKYLLDDSISDSYLVVCELLKTVCSKQTSWLNGEEGSLVKEIRQLIKAYDSYEVQMHYYSLFED